VALTIGGSFGCEGCSEADEGETAETQVVTPTNGSGFVAFGTDDAGETDEPGQPESRRPDLRHDEPPTAADFATTPIEGAWTMWRGGSHRSGLREAPPIAEPQVIWSANVGIQGYTNTVLIADDNTLYVSSQGSRHNQSDDQDGVAALDPTNGTELWRFTTPSDANGMTLDGDRLYVATDDGTLFALNRADGTEAWRLDAECGLYQGPIVHNGEIWLVRRDSNVRVNAETGEPITPLTFCPSGERGSFSALGDDLVAAPNARPLERWIDGDLAWIFASPGDTSPRFGSWTPPTLTASMVVHAHHRWPFGRVGDSPSRRPGAVVWWRDNGQLVTAFDVNDYEEATDTSMRPTPFLRSAPWIFGGYGYWTPVNRPALVKFDLTTGEVVAERRMPDCRRRQFGSIVGTPDQAYLPRHDGVLYAFAPDDLSVAWTLQLGMHALAGTTETHQPVQDGCSEYPIDGSSLFATPSIAPDGTLYVGGGDGWLYAIRDASWGDPPGITVAQPSNTPADEASGDEDGSGTPAPN
jgi:outer membrane protein assembly factor BamB